MGEGAGDPRMNTLLIAFELPWILTRLSLVAVLDILVVALIFFWLLTVAQGTRAMPLLRGIGILLGVMAVLSQTLDLTALRRLLQLALPALIVALPVIFQPELRRALEKLGQTRTWLNLPFIHTDDADIERVINEIGRAVTQLSRERTGALIVIERETGLQDYVDKATPLDAILTRQLLVQLFVPNTPLHDGAVVVRGDKIIAAGVILPLTDTAVSSSLGTRHRAALGISEQSDAVAVVVSEETGTISLTAGGSLTRNMTLDLLRATLRAYLRVDRDSRRRGDRGLPPPVSPPTSPLPKSPPPVVPPTSPPVNPPENKGEARHDGERSAAD